MVFLECADADGRVFDEGFDPGCSRPGSREGRGVWHAILHGRLTDLVIVRQGILAGRRVDHQSNRVVFDLIENVRASLADLEDALRLDAAVFQEELCPL